MLHYYRCTDCLSALTFDGNLQADCACGGILEYLGEVRDDGRAIETVKLPICDGRCTCATGISCRCQCGGANHGTHLTVIVEYDNGKAIVKPVDTKAIARGAEYREAVEQARKRIDDKFGASTVEDYLRGRWISDKAMWNSIRLAFATWHKAQGLRTHNGRIKALKSI